MRFSYISSVIVVVSALSVMLNPTSVLGQVTVGAKTYELTSSGYKKLPGVGIQVYRNGNPIGDPSEEHEIACGSHKLVVTGDAPFDVLFFVNEGGPADDKLPAIYNLAGKTGTTNQVHVVMYTVLELRILGIEPNEELERILLRIRGDRTMTRRLEELRTQLRQQDEHLERLNRDEQFPFTRTRAFDQHLERLRKLELIEFRADAPTTIQALPQKHEDLRRFFQPTDRGREYLKLQDRSPTAR